MTPTTHLPIEHDLCPGCHKGRVVARIYRDGEQTGYTLYCPICNATYRYDDEDEEPEEPGDVWDEHGFRDAADWWRWKCA